MLNILETGLTLRVRLFVLQDTSVLFNEDQQLASVCLSVYGLPAVRIATESRAGRGSQPKEGRTREE